MVVNACHDNARNILFQNGGRNCSVFQKTSSPGKHVREINTPGPLYNMVRNNTVLDITLITVGPQLFWLYVYTFYSHYNMDWIANTEIGLDPRNSVIKRLRHATFIHVM